MRYIDKQMPPIQSRPVREDYYEILNFLISNSSFYDAIDPEVYRSLDALIPETHVVQCLDSTSVKGIFPSMRRSVRGRITRYTEDLNLHYELLQVRTPEPLIKEKEQIMPTGIELTSEEASAPLSYIPVCAGKRLDEMSESDMVHHLKNFQEKVDKLKALKVTSKKIKASIKTLEEQLEALVEAYDAI